MTKERLYNFSEFNELESGCIYNPTEALHQALNCDFHILHFLTDFCVSIAAWGWGLKGAVKISSH